MLLQRPPHGPKEKHFEETRVYQDINPEGREDVPQPGRSLSLSLSFSLCGSLNGRFVFCSVSAEQSRPLEGSSCQGAATTHPQCWVAAISQISDLSVLRDLQRRLEALEEFIGRLCVLINTLFVFGFAVVYLKKKYD